MTSKPMLAALRHRTLIIGNSGSGKSTLAACVSAYAACPNIDLDAIHWADIETGKKQDEQRAREMTVSVSLGACWVIEGVYGWLAEVAAPRATALIWLNLPWDECKAGLLHRGARRGADVEQFNQLVSWAEQYSVRRTPSSFVGHARIFDQFSADKIQLRCRAEVTDFARALRRTD
jgi:adenylate kinase family enzyme